MKSSLMSDKLLGSCGPVLAVTLAALMLTVPHEALAKGGTFHLFSAAQAATTTSPRTEATTATHPQTIPIDAVVPPILAIEVEDTYGE